MSVMAEMDSRFTTPREVLLDSRGTGLRLSWHAEEGVAVLSIWRDDRCIGTFRATPSDMASVIAYLSIVLAAQAEAGLPAHAEPA